MEMIDKNQIYSATFGKIVPEQEVYEMEADDAEAKGMLGYNEKNMVKVLSLLLVALSAFCCIGCCFFVTYKLLFKRCFSNFQKGFQYIKGKIFFNTLLRTGI